MLTEIARWKQKYVEQVMWAVINQQPLSIAYQAIVNKAPPDLYKEIPK